MNVETKSIVPMGVALLHPATRIVLLLFLCIAGSTAGHAQLAFLFILLCVGFALGQRTLFLKTLKVFYRLKWLFISILLLYLFVGTGGFHWRLSALEPGALRVVSLMLLIAAVNLLVQSASPGEFIAALLWLMSPLRWLGVPTQRVAIRMALTLTMVSKLQLLFEREAGSQTSPMRKDVRHYVAGLANLAATRVEMTLQQTQKSVGEEIEIEPLAIPGVGQVVFFLVVVGVYLGLSHF